MEKTLKNDTHIFIKHFILLIIFFLKINYSYAFQTGKYPFTKKLNNGNYIILSSTSIIIVDSSFKTVLKTNTFENSVNLGHGTIGSTTVAQFESNDNGYIIAILYNILYILDSGGTILYEETLTFISGDLSCSLIPNSHSGIDYYFTIIYSVDSGGANNNDLINIQFKKTCFHDNDSSRSIEYITNDSMLFNIGFKINGYFSCDKMKKDNQNYIGCFYGDENKFVSSIFDFNSYEKKNMTIKSGMGGQIFKAIIKPEEMEKALICSYRSGMYFVCLNYDINSYSFGEFQVAFDSSSKQCKYLGGSLIMEYFPETGQFIVGCAGNHIEYHLSQFSSELNFVKLINTTEADSSESLLRINIVLPSGETKYQMLASTSVNQEPILIEIYLPGTIPAQIQVQIS